MPHNKFVLGVLAATSICALACGNGSAPLSHEGEVEGAGDRLVTSTTIGDRFPEITRIDLVVNLYDGFLGAPRNDEIVVDVPSRQVSLNGAPALTATAEQILDLIELVRGIDYRDHRRCQAYLAIDGAQFAPRLTVSDVSSSHVFGAADTECARSDHAHIGDVMSCPSFDALARRLDEIVPGATAIDCASHSYW